MKILVTGAAGFIGFHVSRKLLDRGAEVVGLDNMNSYYDVKLKEARLSQLTRYDSFSFIRGDLVDSPMVFELFATHKPERVIHLAAQAGVRYSLTRPEDYIQSNIVGFLNILEACREHEAEHLIFASSSSVYGANTRVPFSVHDCVDHPLSIYAASKKSNELMAHVYAHLYRLPATGLRFFTVYGPWGRPDMALFKFVKQILADEVIDVYNNGNHARDFTYIDDVVEVMLRMIDRPPAPNPEWSGDNPDPGTSLAPYRLYNIGNHTAVSLMDFIGLIEKALGREARKNYLDLQPGDVPRTYADVTDLTRDFGYSPNTSVAEGISRFVAWYHAYYGV
ncbi:capsular biosynthesis protein CpsI [Methyloceanibacter marginalis]|uniref:Capsular biosynthesis protein CpsI n=1 Tax=Methyloceanibacter marginalis TaxID=1774971 RepID=A0A1E3VU28_9HYPH|nr:NAD-dependent epimerase [Methyloceanibacter marginalis]ODR96791.1 capsular biosynthesis protein CpsI [Methyloceanibacter marginalis]